MCPQICPPLKVSKGQKHGMAKTRVYRIWLKIHSRCSNKNNPRYKYYGGRGIKVCESWSEFINFFNDMGHPPSDKHSIDRINNNGNYEPDNCRWATYIEQANNRSNNYYIDYLGLIYTLSEWARKLNIKTYSLHYMLSRGHDLKAVIKELDLMNTQICLKFN